MSREDLLRAVLENSFDIVTIVDRSGTVIVQSPVSERILGLAPEQLVGQVIWELVHPDDVERVEGMLRDLFGGGGVRSGVFQMRHRDGSWRTLEATARRFFDAGDPHVVLTCRDVTRSHPAEAVPRDRDERLRQTQKMATLGQLAGGIAHDFGNLLTIIIGASGQLLDALPAGSPLTRHVGSIRSSAERAAAMTKQLLAFSRHRESAPTLVDVNDLLMQTEQLLRPLIGEDIELRTVTSAGLWRVRADRTEVEQVLLNLAINARDAMPSGGRLTIETSNVASPSASGGATPPGDYVAVSVSDTGVGMDAATQARAFEPFFTTKEAGGGTGLGLATVHRIVEHSDGWIHLASAPGGGTTVTFGLPRAIEAVAEPTFAPATRPGDLPRGDETLLLVEDEDGVRDLVRDILELAGYRVLVASVPSAAERISRDFDSTIHLLLTDVVMPEMSGLELAERVRMHRPNIQVMYMSGYPEPTTRDGGASAPGTFYLSKPFERQALLGRLREALDAAPAPR